MPYVPTTMFVTIALTMGVVPAAPDTRRTWRATSNNKKGPSECQAPCCSWNKSYRSTISLGET
jgi:hypothetical protein